jgi:class 3 adenylate cyclase/tetratricopeptide (TPR) repeat protein
LIDLKQWLESQGLAQYAQVLADNDIDFDLLAELSEADLEKLGLSLGHRRKLVRALQSEGRGAAPRPPAPAAPAPVEPTDAERRQITVMFCDLVGSTEIANALDPEDASVLMRRYQDACAGAVARFNGYVAKFMGDGVLAYFGYPQAMEDAAEHAVRSALALVDAVAKIKRPDGTPCQSRVGISTGVVVIGELVGTGSAREHSIAGETPNLAARLQALAQPDAIIIGPRTHRLLGERFEYESLGEHVLKGFTTAVPIWRVLREAAAETRFAATRAAARGAFVGRKQESALLLERWQSAIQGRGQAVVISGEPGMGKSRLADALSDRLAGERHYRVSCQCSPYHTNSALHPVIRHLERAAGFATADAESTRLDKLEALVGESPPAQATALIADLLSLPVDRYPAIELAPPQRKAATFAALVDLLKRLAADAPVLLLIEDAHWIDPTTQELWTRLIDGIASTRLLALVTARPEFASPWTGRENVISIELTRLNEAQAAELVREIIAPRAFEPALVGDIVAKSDGVPLYVEELTRSVLESPTPERPAVPATLHDSLLARLDRLGQAKEIAQVAAVIGQQFSHALLARVVAYPAAELAHGLLQLLEAGLAYHTGGRAGEASYSFKHALVRDVAYENLLRGRRQQLHQRIGAALADHFAAVADAEPEVIAHHFHHAGMFEQALLYRERAGDRAITRSSYAEAVAHFGAALEDAARLPEGREKTARELALLLKLGPPLTIIKGGQSADVKETYRRAHQCATAAGDGPGLFKATWGLWYHANIGRRLDEARMHADQLTELGRKTGDDDLLLEGLHCKWSTAWFRGDVNTTLEDAVEGIRRYDRAKHSWMGPVFGGHDPGLCAHCVMGMALAARGRSREAIPHVERAIELGDELGQANNRAHALLNALTTAQLAGDCAATIRYAQRAIELGEKYNLPPARAHAAMISGWALAFGSDLAGGLTAMEIEYPRASAVGPFFRYYAGLLAEGMEKAGRYADALEVVRPVLAASPEPGVGFYVPELLRVQGLCLIGLAGDRDEAMRSLRTAVEIAKRNGISVLELRAALSLARVSAGTREAAQDLLPLRAFISSLPAGFESAMLAEAKQLLARAS